MRKNSTDATAAAVEKLLIGSESESEAASLITDILYDLQNETEVSVTHPSLVRLYILECFKALPSLDEHSRETARRSLGEVQEILAGCSNDRFDQIDYQYNPTHPTRRREVPEKLSNPNKRLAPLTQQQHTEIANLIRSSMDRTKNPTPVLTYQGRIVVRREVTRLARIASVRRLKGHATTFTRALAEFERKVSDEGLNPREGRLCIEHLWQWLHGYVKPQPAEAERSTQDALPDGDNFTVARGLMMVECGNDFPAEGLKKGAMVMVRKGAPIENGKLGLVRFKDDYYGLNYIFHLDPSHIRFGNNAEDIFHVSQVDIIGPVVTGTFTRLPKDEERAAINMFRDGFALTEREPSHNEWPDTIGGGDDGTE